MVRLENKTKITEDKAKIAVCLGRIKENLNYGTVQAGIYRIYGRQ